MSEPKEDKGKPFPVFYTDAEAEHFLETADLSEYDFSQFKPMRFYLKKKDARVNMRLPEGLLNSVKAAALEEKVPYQSLIRDYLEQGLAERKKAKLAPRKKAS